VNYVHNFTGSCAAGEVEHILGGHFPNRTDLSRSIYPKGVTGYIQEPTVAQQMHCVVMCIPAPSATEPTHLERLKDMKQAAMSKGGCAGWEHIIAFPGPDV
jgi:hypothetical protein